MALNNPVQAAQRSGLMSNQTMIPANMDATGLESSSQQLPSVSEDSDISPIATQTMQMQNTGAVKMPPGMAKGGMLAEGGVMQEGGTVDPESGNEVPPGALQEEVRDDIPAQLSEGEFIFPADVVRFIGLEKLMRLRQAAKKGLKQMDDMGQMGNASEAVIEDDAEFETEIDDIIEEIEKESRRGQEAPEAGMA